MKGVVELNVGGKKFCVSESLFVNISYFEILLKQKKDCNESGPLFVEADPTVFKHWLRSIRMNYTVCLLQIINTKEN